MDIHENLRIGTVTVAPDPADSGTTLSVSNADGEKFADPEGEGNTPYNVTVFPPDDTPDIDNAEIVRITAKDIGETNTEFTIIREQEDTNAREIQVGDKIAWTITKKTIADIEEALEAAGDANNLVLIPAPEDDHVATGIKITLTAGENLAFGDVGYMKVDGKVWKGDADAIATASVIVMALEAINADAPGSFLLRGVVRDDSWNWTVGGLIYLSTDAGALTQTAPAGSNDVVQVLGVATHADRMLFKPSLVQVERL